MGVLMCNRGDCEHVMCDRYSARYGYICNDCFDELCSLGVINQSSIKHFMDSDPTHRVDYMDFVRDFLNAEFKLPNED